VCVSERGRESLCVCVIICVCACLVSHTAPARLLNSLSNSRTVGTPSSSAPSTDTSVTAGTHFAIVGQTPGFLHAGRPKEVRCQCAFLDVSHTPSSSDAVFPEKTDPSAVYSAAALESSSTPSCPDTLSCSHVEKESVKPVPAHDAPFREG